MLVATHSRIHMAASVDLARRLGLETHTVVDGLGGGPLVSSWQAAKLKPLLPVAGVAGPFPRMRGACWARPPRSPTAFR